MRYPSTPEEDFYLNVKEVASILGKSTRVVHRWGTRGVLESQMYPVSGTPPQVFYPLEAVLEFAQKMDLRADMEMVRHMTDDETVVSAFEKIAEREKTNRHQNTEQVPTPDKTEDQDDSRLLSFVLKENEQLKKAIETKDQEIGRLNQEYLQKSDKLSENLIKLEALRIIASIKNAENTPTLVQAIRQELGVGEIVEAQANEKKTLFQRWFGD